MGSECLRCFAFPNILVCVGLYLAVIVWCFWFCQIVYVRGRCVLLLGVFAGFSFCFSFVFAWVSRGVGVLDSVAFGGFLQRRLFVLRLVRKTVTQFSRL